VNFALKEKFVVKLSLLNINLEGPRFLKINIQGKTDKNLQNPSLKIFALENFWLHIKATEKAGQLGHFFTDPTL